VAKLETVIKEAIARGARRQVRVGITPLRREVVRLRKKMTELQATVATLRWNAVGWKRLMEAAPAAGVACFETYTPYRMGLQRL
jgi:hypothetical protein